MTTHQHDLIEKIINKVRPKAIHDTLTFEDEKQKERFQMNLQYFSVNMFATGMLSYMLYFFRFVPDQHPLVYLLMAASSVFFI